MTKLSIEYSGIALLFKKVVCCAHASFLSMSVGRRSASSNVSDMISQIPDMLNSKGRIANTAAETVKVCSIKQEDVPLIVRRGGKLEEQQQPKSG